MRFSFAWIPTTQFSVKERDARHASWGRVNQRTDSPRTIREQAYALKHVLDDDRLEYVQLDDTGHH
jgi:hypothetical protein